MELSQWKYFFESLNFKLPLIVLSCFLDMIDKKRKKANSFRNTSYENKFSKVVKPIETY